MTLQLAVTTQSGRGSVGSAGLWDKEPGSPQMLQQGAKGDVASVVTRPPCPGSAVFGDPVGLVGEPSKDLASCASFLSGLSLRSSLMPGVQVSALSAFWGP